MVNSDRSKSVGESATTIDLPDHHLIEKLSKIQRTLKAPKGQTNAFGKYKYRSCEDILTAVKPHLDGLILKLSDEIVEVGGRIYVKAMASIADGQNSTYVCGWAREAEDKKGMDAAQITGAASSYARKYALNGLFCIDDTKDADHTNNGSEGQATPKKTTPKRVLEDIDLTIPGEEEIEVEPIIERAQKVFKGTPTNRPTPEGFKMMPSKYDGECKGCGKAFPQGEEILWSSKKGVFHYECA